MYVFMYVRMYIHMHVYMYMHMYVHTYAFITEVDLNVNTDETNNMYTFHHPECSTKM